MTIDCAGCGLPRAEAEADRPCPVCEAGVHDLPAERRRVEVSFPTDGLPADASRLHTAAEETPQGHRPEVVAGVIGIVLGVGLVLAVQGLLPSRPAPEPIAAPAPSLGASLYNPTPIPPPAAALEATRPTIPLTEESPRALTKVETAPAPHEATALASAAAKKARPTLIIDFDRPDASIAITSTLIGKGGSAVLRGRVKTLNFWGMERLTIDASGLTAETIHVGGPFTDSTLKLNAPKGRIAVASKIMGASTVELNAPDGEVLFSTPSSGIEGGSRVEIATRSLDLRGPIAGDKTYVRVTLGAGGSMKATALRGKATLEYRKSKPSDSAPNIDIPKGQIDASATFRRAD